jgi:DNA-3-methyladenine glycosylase I
MPRKASDARDDLRESRDGSHDRNGHAQTPANVARRAPVVNGPVVDAGGTPRRCDWAGNALSVRYHDEEWGVPVRDDRRWFEFLVLEGAQAGLSWDTILRKRDRYRTVFDGFDPALVARYDASKVEALLADPGIIRNRLKVASAVANARAFLGVRDEFGSFDAFIWRAVGGRPRANAWHSQAEVPARTAESDALSKELKRRGFNFVGTTICYAFMQATGLVNDHLVGCFRHAQVGGTGIGAT